MFTTLDRFEADYRDKRFVHYSPVTTLYGVPLHHIDDALSFLLFHEGFHLSYILALKHLS